MVQINKESLEAMLGGNFNVIEREEGFYEIWVPFLDKRNDFISIYMKTFENSTIISDYGETLGDIEYYDLDEFVKKIVKTSVHYKLSDSKNIFTNIKHNVDEQEFLFTVFELIKIILSINGLATFIDIFTYEMMQGNNPGLVSDQEFEELYKNQ